VKPAEAIWALVAAFRQDPESQAIVMIDEIGGDAEVKRAKFIMKKSRGRSSDLLQESLHLLAAGWNRGPDHFRRQRHGDRKNESPRSAWCEGRQESSRNRERS